jgi:hypothetical protein
MGAFTSAWQNKLDAINDLQVALYARKTNTAADDTTINPTLQNLALEEQSLEAAIEADDAPVLPGPTPADATALQNAIKAAENAIAANAAVNTLVNAAAVLIGTMSP